MAKITKSGSFATKSSSTIPSVPITATTRTKSREGHGVRGTHNAVALAAENQHASGTLKAAVLGKTSRTSKASTGAKGYIALDSQRKGALGNLGKSSRWDKLTDEEKAALSAEIAAEEAAEAAGIVLVASEAVASILAGDQQRVDTQTTPVPSKSARRTKTESAPIPDPSAGISTSRGTRLPTAPIDQAPPAGTSGDVASVFPAPIKAAPVAKPSLPSKAPVAPKEVPSGGNFDLEIVHVMQDAGSRLLAMCRTLDAIESARMETGNRLDAATRLASYSAATVLQETLEGYTVGDIHFPGLVEIEERLTKTVEGVMRKEHPLGPWVKNATGVGFKQAARLLAAIGDPYWHTVEERPRLVSELISYCGFAVDDQGVAVRRRKGEQARWSTDAKIRALLIADSIIKSGGSYRELYDMQRDKYADAVHVNECMNRSRYSPNGCGTREHPEWGHVGAPLRPGHQHAIAKRYVAKQVLKDLWAASRSLHLSSSITSPAPSTAVTRTKSSNGLGQ